MDSISELISEICTALAEPVYDGTPDVLDEQHVDGLLRVYTLDGAFEVVDGEFV